MKSTLAYKPSQSGFAKLAAILFTFTCALSISTCWSKTYGDATVKRIVRVYDGDTFTADIDAFSFTTKDGKKKVLKDLHPVISEAMNIRIFGIDTPEMKSKSEKVRRWAIKARDRARALLNAAKEVILTNIGKDKYFRFDATVWVDGHNLGQTLIDEGLALPYDGGKKADWEAHLDEQSDQS